MSELSPGPSPHVARSIFFHALAAAFMCISPLVVFVPAAYMSAGLRNGRKGTTLAVAGSVVLLAAIAAVGSTPAVFTGHLAEITALLFALGIPSMVAAAMMRRGEPFGRILFAVVLTSVAGLFLTEILVRAGAGVSPYHALLENFRAQSTSTIGIYRKLGWSEESLRQMGRFSETVAVSFMVLMLESLIITAFLLSMIMIPRIPVGRATGTAYLLRNLRFPDALIVAFVLGGISPLLTGVPRIVGLNLLGITIFLYFLQGLAVLRSVLVRIGIGLGGTVVASLMIGLFVPLSIGALFLVGLFDPFFDFRKMNRKDDSNESHTD